MDTLTYRGSSSAAIGRAAEAAWRADPEPDPTSDPTHDPGVVIHPVRPEPAA